MCDPHDPHHSHGGARQHPEPSPQLRPTLSRRGLLTAAGPVLDLLELDARTAGFARLNGQANALRAAGVRIFGPNASVAQDMEPEYIAVSADGTTALATLQENNAVAVIDIHEEEAAARGETLYLVPGRTSSRGPANAP